MDLTASSVSCKSRKKVFKSFRTAYARTRLDTRLHLATSIQNICIFPSCSRQRTFLTWDALWKIKLSWILANSSMFIFAKTTILSMSERKVPPGMKTRASLEFSTKRVAMKFSLITNDLRISTTARTSGTGIPILR